MSNPWRTIPESDYIGHMANPAVGQYNVLDALFAAAVADARPVELLVVGCSTGHGFDHIDSSVTRRVTGVEINQHYVSTLRRRADHWRFALDVRCADISTCAFDTASFDLIHAALVLEYVPWRELLPHLASWLKPGGVLSVVLQRPSAATPAVTPTPFTSLLAPESIFTFVEPEQFIREANRHDMALVSRQVVPLPSAKSFAALRLRRQ